MNGSLADASADGDELETGGGIPRVAYLIMRTQREF